MSEHKWGYVSMVVVGLVLIGIALLLGGYSVGVQREACRASGGVYVWQTFSSDHCIEATDFDSTTVRGTGA